MTLLQTYIDPASTSQLLNNLNSAIDEVNLVNTLDDMTHRIQKIESTNGQSDQTQHLHREIKILEIQINYIRDRAAFC